MNRRYFLKSAAVFAAGIAASPLLAAEFSKPRGPIPPLILKHGRAVVNPEWRNAAYQLGFFTSKGNVFQDTFPWRFRSPEDGYAFVEWMESGKARFAGNKPK